MKTHEILYLIGLWSVGVLFGIAICNIIRIIVKNKKKYIFNHYPFTNDPTKLYSKKDAIKRLNEFIETCRRVGVREKCYHLFLHNNQWWIIADSVKYKYSNGIHIKAIKI